MKSSPNSATSQVTVSDLRRPPESSHHDSSRLVAIRTLWGAIAALVVSLVLTGIPIRYEKVRTADPTIRNPEFRDLIEAGIRPEVAAAYDLGVGLLLFLAMLGGGVVLFVRGWKSREAIFLSSTIILYGMAFSGLATVHRTAGDPFSQSAAGLLATLAVFLSTAATFTGLFWLPEGRFGSRWSAWLTLAAVVIVAGLYLTVPYPRAHNLVNIVRLPVVAMGVLAQALNYRRISNPVTRQQIKWLVVGIVVTAVGFLVWQSATLFLANRAGLTPRLAMVLIRLLAITSQLAVPVCLSIAVLRYRLWQSTRSSTVRSSMAPSRSYWSSYSSVVA